MTTNLDFDYDDFSKDLEQSIENEINNIKTIDDFAKLVDSYTNTIESSFSMGFEDDELDFEETGIFKE